MTDVPKIGDTVYFFMRSDSHDYPDLCKGPVTKYITGIHGDVGMLRIEVTNGYGVGYHQYIELERCFTDVRELLADLKQHIDAETQAVDGCLYDW